MYICIYVLYSHIYTHIHKYIYAYIYTYIYIINKSNSTTLSRKVWKLKDQNQNFELKWKILSQAKPYQSGDSCCQLCLAEIFIILFQPEEATLNARSEIFNKCRHSNKFKLDKAKL